MTTLDDATPMELAALLRRAAAGLSIRQSQVLRMAGQGMGDKEIARRMGVTTFTVKNHLTQAYRKLERAGLPAGNDYPRAHYAYLFGLLDGVRWATYGTGDPSMRAEMV